MGLFDKEKHNDKCTCEKCKPSTGKEVKELDKVPDGELVAESLGLDAEQILNAYVEAVLECETPEEVREMMDEFFEVASAYTIQEVYLADIEAKVQALNLLKEKFQEE